MKVDAKMVVDHLKMITMGKRVEEAVLGPHFSADIVDEQDTVMLRAALEGVKFGKKFGVAKLVEFVKLLTMFGGEVDMELDKEKRLVMTSGDVTVWYQTSDVDKIGTTLTSFDDASKQLDKTMIVDVEPSETFIENFTKTCKHVAPDMIEIAVKSKRVVMKMISAKTRHRAEVIVGGAQVAAKKKFESIKLSGEAVIDVLSGVKPGEGDQLKLSLGKVLRVEFRSYVYLVSPLTETSE